MREMSELSIMSAYFTRRQSNLLPRVELGRGKARPCVGGRSTAAMIVSENPSLRNRLNVQPGQSSITSWSAAVMRSSLLVTKDTTLVEGVGARDELQSSISQLRDDLRPRPAES